MSSPACAYGAAAPCEAGLLPVGNGHVLHWEATGAGNGIPALVLHGGPGSGGSAALYAGFDLGRYRVAGFDQRGSGRSTPRGETRHNDTAALIADIERLRHHMGIASWLVVGGSWGATLALAYAARHPQAVRGLLLRNLFVPSEAELHWFFQEAAMQHPRAWQALADLAPAAERGRLLPWLGRVFSGEDAALQARVAAAWLGWELALGGQAAGLPPAGQALQRAVDRFKVQAHYLLHRCWTGLEDWRSLAGLGLPVLFLHGARDRVCRPEAARAVQQALPGSDFVAVDAGHDPFHPAMAAAMARALETFAATGRFGAPAGLP